MIHARFLSPAEWEMVQTAQYYESKVPHLGADFLLEVNRAVKSIETNPEAAPKIEGEIRRRLIMRFPYAILYRVDADELIILAVMHQRRHPDYWHGRVEL